MIRPISHPLAAAVWFCAMAAQAEDGGPLHDRFAVNLGTFFMSSDTTVRADAFNSDNTGTRFNFEDTFGLEDDDVFRVDAAWRMTERHLVRAMYFQSERSVSHLIDRDIEFGDQTFPLDAAVQAQFDFDITELAYEYVFLLRDEYQLSASLGIHNAGFRMALAADVGSPGQGSGMRISESVRTNAPLPVLGLLGRWHLTGDLYALAHAQYFRLSFDAYDGDLQDYEAALVWQLTQHVGVGAAYNLFVTNIATDDRDHFEGELRWRYSGAQLFMRLSF